MCNKADPNLILISKDKKIEPLKTQLLKYMNMLRDVSHENPDEETIKDLFEFNELSDNHLGFCEQDIFGKGIGPSIAANWLLGLKKWEWGEPPPPDTIALLTENIGPDRLSDLTTNIVQHELLELTENFAKEYIQKKQLNEITIQKSRFDFKTGKWVDKKYTLPAYQKDGDIRHVILSPTSILSSDKTWINRDNFIKSLLKIPKEILEGIDSTLPSKIRKLQSEVAKKSQKEMIDYLKYRADSLGSGAIKAYETYRRSDTAGAIKYSNTRVQISNLTNDIINKTSKNAEQLSKLKGQNKLEKVKELMERAILDWDDNIIKELKTDDLRHVFSKLEHNTPSKFISNEEIVALATEKGNRTAALGKLISEEVDYVLLIALTPKGYERIFNLKKAFEPKSKKNRVVIINLSLKSQGDD